MPKRRLPYTLREVTRHGAVAWYFRRGKGKRIRLPSEYGSPEFLQAYNAALSGQPVSPDLITVKRGTVKWLADRWEVSARFREARPSTQKQRRLTLAIICRNAGHVELSKVTPAMIAAGLDARAATPAAANWYLKVVKAMFRWAVEAGHMASSPAGSVKGLRNRTPGFTPWTDDDMAAFRARWPIGTKQRLALELLAATGLRRGDVVRIGPQHLDGTLLSIETEKTGTVAHIGMGEEILQIIAASPSGHLLWLTTEHGEAYSKEGFANWFRRACRAAGVKGSPHGIRKWAAAKDAERGGSEMALRAKYGWESHEQSSTYTRSADRKKLAMSLAGRAAPAPTAPHLMPGAGLKPENQMDSKAKKEGGTP